MQSEEEGKAQHIGKFRTKGNREQFIKRVQLVHQEEEEENYTVLNLEGGDENAKPYHMEGFLNGNKFKAMMNSGSPVTIFALDELKQVMKRD